MQRLDWIHGQGTNSYVIGKLKNPSNSTTKLANVGGQSMTPGTYPLIGVVDRTLLRRWGAFKEAFLRATGINEELGRVSLKAECLRHLPDSEVEVKDPEYPTLSGSKIIIEIGVRQLSV
jgi:hypothetical protein